MLLIACARYAAGPFADLLGATQPLQPNIVVASKLLKPHIAPIVTCRQFVLRMMAFRAVIAL
jgi:hypothetical protein